MARRLRRNPTRDYEYFNSVDMEQQVLFDELATRVVEQSAEAILTLAREMRFHSLTDEEGNLSNQAEIGNAVRDIEWALESNTGFMYMADAVGTQLVIKCRYRNKSRYVPAIDIATTAFNYHIPDCLEGVRVRHYRTMRHRKLATEAWREANPDLWRE